MNWKFSSFPFHEFKQLRVLFYFQLRESVLPHNIPIPSDFCWVQWDIYICSVVPEVILGSGYSVSCDIWSLGVLGILLIENKKVTTFPFHVFFYLYIYIYIYEIHIQAVEELFTGIGQSFKKSKTNVSTLQK